MSKDKSSISAYGVGDGKLYIGAGRLTEEELRREEYLAGESEGGCRLTYTAKSFPIRDINGSVVTVLRYGEKTVVSGRLRRIDVSVLSALTGCGCEKENGRETLCLGTGSDRRREVSALLACPLPDGEELVIIARGTAVSGIDMRLDTDRDSAVGFELVSCGDGSYLTIK